MHIDEDGHGECRTLLRTDHGLRSSARKHAAGERGLIWARRIERAKRAAGERGAIGERAGAALAAALALGHTATGRNKSKREFIPAQRAVFFMLL